MTPHEQHQQEHEQDCDCRNCIKERSALPTKADVQHPQPSKEGWGRTIPCRERPEAKGFCDEHRDKFGSFRLEYCREAVQSLLKEEIVKRDSRWAHELGKVGLEDDKFEDVLASLTRDTTFNSTIKELTQ